MSKLKITHWKVADLKPAEYNPRILTKPQYERIKDSITKFGFVDPIIVNTHEGRAGIIIGGHQRVAVAKDVGIEDVPCIEVSLTIERERELNVRLNKNVGEWDYDLLATKFTVDELRGYGFEEWELPGLPDVDVEQRTFTKEEIKEGEKVQPNTCICPKCNHEFPVVLKRNMKYGKGEYSASISDIPSKAGA